MKVYLGSDHRGFRLKEELKIWLLENHIAGEDLGAYEFDPDDDYPVFSGKVAKAVVSDLKKGLDAKGVLLCGSGVGADAAANKFDGIRASIGINIEQVKAGRRDDDMNVLVIAADLTSKKEAKEMVKAFLETDFIKNERHQRRLLQIKKIEANN